MRTPVVLFVVLLVCVWGSATSEAQTPDFVAAVQAGGAGTDVSFGIAVDDAGDLIVGGWFRNTAYFNGTIVTAVGQQPAGRTQDLFVAKSLLSKLAL